MREKFGVGNSVADLGCLSWIPDPDLYTSRIPDTKTATKERGEKNSCHIFFCGHKFHKIKNYFIFEMLKKFRPTFKEFIQIFTQKIVTKLSKIWVWDPGSGKNLFRIPDPGVKKAPDPGSGSATLVGKSGLILGELFFTQSRKHFLPLR
jgi:hypothetical protein